jgi:serine/threonine protein kinase
MPLESFEPHHESWLLDEGDEVDNYRVVRHLGRGGMSQVYLAKDLKLGRKVALKTIRPGALGSVRSVERFVFEVRTTAHFNHPNIVTVYGVGEVFDHPYVALEHLEGQTLRNLLRERKQLEIDEALAITKRIAEALRAAHSALVLHRDLKPENVMLTADRQLRVLDFGLATTLERPDLGQEFRDISALAYGVFETRDEELRGTPAYMAPEQWEQRDVEAGTDIWALGVMLYEMLAGVRPFVGKGLEAQAKATCKLPTPLLERRRAAIPSELSQLIGEMLRKRCPERPTAEHVLHALQQISEQLRTDSVELSAPSLPKVATTSSAGVPIAALGSQPDVDALSSGERFRVDRELWRGRTGIVYKSYDRRRQEWVALKRPASSQTAALRVFKREFRALTDLGHPNLLSLYDLRVDDDDCFMTMELVEGEDLLSYVAAEPLGSAARLERVLATFGQLADALCRVQLIGYRVQAITKERISVTPAGRVVLLELAHEPCEQAVNWRSVTQTGVPLRGVGCHGKLWRSFGELLFCALTDSVDVQHGQLAHRFADYPKALIDLCERLLNDEQNLPTAAQIVQCFGRREAPEPPPNTLLFGRSEQLRQLRRCYREVKEGAGRIVLLRGRSGIGKTELATRFLGTLSDALVLKGRCYQRESIPFKALDGVVDELAAYLGRLPEQQRSPLLSSETASLAQTFPVLEEVVPVYQERALAERGAELRQRAFFALRLLLCRIARHTPVVLFVDDLQWGDSESATLFIELMRAASPRILLIGAYRDDEMADEGLLATLLAQKKRYGELLSRRLRVIELERLHEDQALELAESLLYPAAHGHAYRIARESGGNPYFIRLLAEHVNQRPDEQAPSSKFSLEAVLATRLAALPDEARRVLEVIAVAGWRLPQAVLRQVAETGQRTSHIVASLRAEQLVRTTESAAGTRVEAYHDRIREAVLALLPADEQRFLHEMLADALARTVDATTPETLYALAQHAYLSNAPGRQRWIYELNNRAAELSAAAHAFDVAFQFLQQASAAAAKADIALSVAFEQLLADVASALGKVDVAMVHANSALSRCQQPLQRAALHRTIARIHNSVLDSAAALEQVRAGLRELGERFSKLGIARLFQALLGFGRGRRVERDESRFGSARGDEKRRCEHIAELHNEAAMACFVMLRPLECATHVLQSYAPAALTGRSRHYVLLRMFLFILSTARRARWASRFFERTRELARELDHPPTEAYFGAAEHFVGRTAQATKRSESTLCTSGHWLENADFFWIIEDLCWNFLMRGYADACWRWVQEGLGRASVAGRDDILTQGHSYRCLAAPALAMRGQFEAGLEHLQSYRASLREPGDRGRWSAYLGHLTLSLVLDERLDETLEEAIARYRALGIKPGSAALRMSHFYVAIAYARLWTWQRARDPRAKKRAGKELSRALRELKKTRTHPTLVGHRLVISAALLQAQGKGAAAEEPLVRAESLARSTENRWVAAECALIRARIAAKQGNQEIYQQAKAKAVRFYEGVGWKKRAKRLDSDLEQTAGSDVESSP